MEAMKTEAESVADIVKAIPQLVGVGAETNVLLVPKGTEVKSVKQFNDEYLKAPERRKGTARLHDLDGFVQHVNRFKDEDSVIFAQTKNPVVMCVLDYHRAGSKGAPRFGEHRSLYQFPLSEQWRFWNEKNNSTMDQGDFAEVIEARVGDLMDSSNPGESARHLALSLGLSFASVSDLIALSKGLSIRQNATVKNHVRLETGETQLQYSTAHTDEFGAELRVPGAFLIAIPVFELGDYYQIAVKLRYRMRADKVVWVFELHRPELVLENAVTTALTKVKEETGLPLIMGTPES